jgi:UDP:flavonoid glycosyltransferase YjiC (YdhE family)
MMLPHRLVGETALRRSARTLLADESFESRARELATWAREHDGAATAATLVERLAEAR